MGVHVESTGRRGLLPGELSTEMERQQKVHTLLDPIMPKCYFIVYENELGALVMGNGGTGKIPSHGLKELFNLVRLFSQTKAQGKCVCGECDK